MGNLPRVPYQEPEPWVPSGGFEQFRSPEERKRDAEEAARREAEIEEALTRSRTLSRRRPRSV
jgi:hypothetical protein